jgi:DNA-binding beta-propeller fold protein YncE
MTAAAVAALLLAQQAAIVQPGLQNDGRTLLANGWSIRPAGKQISLDPFPMSAALTPHGKHLLVLQTGAERPTLTVFDAATIEQTSRATLAGAWLGLAVSPNGRNVYVGGGATASVFEFTLSPEGTLTPARTFAIVPEASRQPADFVGDVALSPDGRLLYAAILTRDTIAVVNPLTGIVIERIRTGRRPYRIVFPPDGRSFYVSAWADAAVIQHKAETGERLSVLRTGPQPMDMVWSSKPVKPDEGEKVDWKGRLFIAAANTNNVYVAGVKESGAAELIETVSVALYPRQPAGMTPSALALNADESRLYVACADANAVAVVDVSLPRSSRLGFIPSGAYPADVQTLAGDRVAILNGQSGTASVVEADDIQTDTVRSNSLFRDEYLDTQPRRSAIEHVVYIVTSDFRGSKPAREFTLLDNFQDLGEEWAVAAIAPPYVVRRAPMLAAFEPAALPPAGRIWNNALAKGLTVRNYGWTGDPALAPHTNARFAAPDADRGQVFAEDLALFEREGKMPRLLMIRMEAEPQVLRSVADAVLKSRFSKSSAVFITGPNAAAVYSPYTGERDVDSTFYNSASVLRTIGLILGLNPMTIFDAAATPITAAFPLEAQP